MSDFHQMYSASDDHVAHQVRSAIEHAGQMSGNWWGGAIRIIGGGTVALIIHALGADIASTIVVALVGCALGLDTTLKAVGYALYWRTFLLGDLVIDGATRQIDAMGALDDSATWRHENPRRS